MKISHALRLPIFILRFVRYVRNWPQYLHNRHADVTYELREGCRMFVRPQDRGSFIDVFVQRSYDISLPWQEMRTIIDAGANIGSFAVFVGQRAPQATIFSLEPEPSTFAVLERNIQNNDGNVLSSCVALAGTNGFAELQVSRTSSGSHSLFRPLKNATHIRVPTMTLDAYCLSKGIKHIDLLKLDCEGAEYDVLEHLPPEGWDMIGSLFLEVHPVPGKSASALLALIEQRHFILHALAPREWLCTRK